MAQASKMFAIAETGLAASGAGALTFVRRRRADGFYWNTSGTPAFETYTAGNIANYGIASAENGVGTGQYQGTDPAPTTEGDYVAVKQAGANLAQTDLANPRWQDRAGPISADAEYLLGTAWLTPGTAGTPDVNAKQIGGAAQTGLDLAANWTAARAAHLDADISTRSTYAGGAVASVTGNVGGSVGSVAAPVTIDLTEAVPLSNTANTLGDCLNAARAQGFGKWTVVGTTLTLFAADGTTAVRTFTLDSSSAPTQRV